MSANSNGGNPGGGHSGHGGDSGGHDHGGGGHGYSHRGKPSSDHSGGHSGGGHADEGHGHSHGGRSCSGHSGGSDLERPLLKNPSHGHGCSHEHGTAELGNTMLNEEQDKLRKAVYCALTIMFIEIIGGILANSLAIVTDAAHMLSDVGGFIVSLACLQLSAAGCTEEYTFGFKQAEVLGALLSIMIVWALTGILLWEAFQRLYNLEEINAPYMFWISVLGFLVNLLLFKILGHNHSHGGQACGGHGGHGEGHGSHGGHQAHSAHGDAHDGAPDEAEKERSLAMKAAIVHVIGDIVQSLGVCVAALCIWWQPFDVGVTGNGVSKWNYADPACTVLFGILVLFTTKATLKQTINNLMVKAPSHVNQRKFMEKLEACPNVASVHDLHVWALGSKDVLCTAHLMVNGRENTMEALKAAISVAQKMGIGHATFQTEVVGEFDPSLESYGFHPNPCGDKKSDHGGGHSHSDGCCSGHGH